MDIRTHRHIDYTLCGTPVSIADGSSQVELQTNDAMAVDENGLVHGGFIFGLADHAAMIAVNHPHVVLGGAEVKFLKPVRAGETVLARAQSDLAPGKKQMVDVTVHCKERLVFEGRFACFILDKHVLA